MNRRRPVNRMLAAGLLLYACASAPPATPESVVFAPALGVNLPAMQRLPSGVYLRDLRTGEGDPVRSGTRVAVHYVGWLHDGTQIEAVAPPDEPIEFRLGAGEVIRGWDHGITGMRPGGQRLLVIPAALAYGREQVGSVPPNSVLVFLVELTGVR
jgi:FKBP-type peptidyl-prolyl cis-trans isomerase